jgi:hypothetical protein
MFTFVIAASVIAVSAGCGPGNGQAYTSELATSAGRVTIVQCGPAGQKPRVRKQLGPGYSILEQDGGGNHVTITQRNLDTN